MITNISVHSQFWFNFGLDMSSLTSKKKVTKKGSREKLGGLFVLCCNKHEYP